LNYIIFSYSLIRFNQVSIRFQLCLSTMYKVSPWCVPFLFIIWFYFFQISKYFFLCQTSLFLNSKWWCFYWFLMRATIAQFFFYAFTTRIPIFSNQPNWLDGFFLLKDMYFWLEAKGLNDNGYFFNQSIWVEWPIWQLIKSNI